MVSPRFLYYINQSRAGNYCFGKRSFKIYVCGPTVYDRPAPWKCPFNCNLRFIISFLYNAIFLVTYVRNITDVDDKINAAALEQKNFHQIN